MSDSNPANSRQMGFASTHWSLVRRAGQQDSQHRDQAREALGKLCQTYWYPIYGYLRQQGYESNLAADLTQGFFYELLKREDIQQVRPELGRFRSFLLASLKNFVKNHWQKENAQKRGGGKRLVSIDSDWAETRYGNENPVSNPESEFDRRWALMLLERGQADLAEDYRERGLTHQFEELKIFLAGKAAGVTVEKVARKLGMSTVAAKVAIHRMRQRFGNFLREQIAQTVANPEEVDDEIRQMFEVLRG